MAAFAQHHLLPWLFHSSKRWVFRILLSSVVSLWLSCSYVSTSIANIHPRQHDFTTCLPRSSPHSCPLVPSPPKGPGFSLRSTDIALAPAVGSSASLWNKQPEHFACSPELRPESVTFLPAEICLRQIMFARCPWGVGKPRIATRCSWCISMGGNTFMVYS